MADLQIWLPSVVLVGQRGLLRSSGDRSRLLDTLLAIPRGFPCSPILLQALAAASGGSLEVLFLRSLVWVLHSVGSPSSNSRLLRLSFMESRLSLMVVQPPEFLCYCRLAVVRLFGGRGNLPGSQRRFVSGCQSRGFLRHAVAAFAKVSSSACFRGRDHLLPVKECQAESEPLSCDVMVSYGSVWR
ncbi:hypothetical protein Bca4012_019822 [Brassica carinata]